MSVHNRHPVPRSRWLARTAVAVAVALAAVGGAAAADGGGGTARPAEGPPPKVVTFPARVGQVTFPHAMHVDDLGIDCTDCHHPVTAPTLDTPHPRYFKACRIPCATCHHADGTARSSHRCTTCHGEPGPRSSRMLSAKVALHRMCGNCHEIGTAKDASASCSFCHTGPRRPW